MSEPERLRTRLAEVLGASGQDEVLDLWVSALTERNTLYSTEEVTAWLDGLNRDLLFDVERVELEAIDGWSFEPDTGDLRHDSGRFFRISGLRVQTNRGLVPAWDQPIIDQREIGVLGLVAKRIDGVLHFLCQAKAEPGNVRTFMLSPTVQATRSNFMRVHGGKPTQFLELFTGLDRARALVDQLQTEQGARFWQKRNRNMVVRVADDAVPEPGPMFRWLTLGQIAVLLRRDDTVNMDLRSVLSCISYTIDSGRADRTVDLAALRRVVDESPISGPASDFALKLLISASSIPRPLHSIEYLLHRMAAAKFDTDLRAELIPLRDVKGWVREPLEIRHEEDRFFSIIGVHIAAERREVPSWSQPIVRQRDPGLVGFVLNEFGGVLHVLVQMKLESGNMDLLEFAPTVQCITGSYGSIRPAYVDDLLAPTRGTILYDAMQSEEGGRFFQESNRNMLLLADESFPDEPEDGYVWMTLGQLKELVKFNNSVNVEARSLLAAVKQP